MVTGTDSGADSRSRSRRVPPSTSSITRKTRSPSRPWSYTATTPECPRDAANRASRSNRLRNAGSETNCGLITLIATGRSSLVSTPR